MNNNFFHTGFLMTSGSQRQCRAIAAVLVLALLALFSGTGCKSAKVVKDVTTITTDSTTTVSDSAWSTVRVEYRDSIIKLPGETRIITEYVDCDEQGQVNLPPVTNTGQRASVAVSIRDNRLVATATCDSLQALVNLQDSIINHYNRTTIDTRVRHSKQTVREVPVRYIPKWIKWLAGIGSASIAAWVLFIIIKIKLPL